MRRTRDTSVKFSLFAFQDIITSVTGIMVLITLIMALDLLDRTQQMPETTSKQVLEELLAAIESQTTEIEKRQSKIAERGAVLKSDAVLDAQSVQEELEEISQKREKLFDDLARLEKLQTRVSKQLSEINKYASDPKLNAEIESLTTRMKEARRKLAKIKKMNRIVFEPAEGTPSDSWIVQLGGKRSYAARAKVKQKPLEFKSRDAIENWIGEQEPGFCLLLVKPDAVEVFRGVKYRLDSLNLKYGFDVLPADQQALDPEIGAGIEE